MIKISEEALSELKKEVTKGAEKNPIYRIIILGFG